jgi:hypothetical protein
MQAGAVGGERLIGAGVASFFCNPVRPASRQLPLSAFYASTASMTVCIAQNLRVET